MILSELRDAGFHVRLVNGDDIGVSPASKLSPDMASKIRAAKVDLVAQLQSESTSEHVLSGGPGSELKKIVPSWLESQNCGCTDKALQMDNWGVAGCSQRRSEIVDFLLKQSRRPRLTKHFPDGLKRIVADRWVQLAIDRSKLTVVWVYWHRGATGDELRYSMRSARRSLADASNFVLCGENPGWFDGDFIHCPRFSESKARQKYGSDKFTKWIDSIEKLRAICESPLVTENFLWLYDDTFIVKPTSIGELSRPKVRGVLHAGDLNAPIRKSWRELRRRTAKDLVDRELPQHNYSTHYPVVYNKTKLLATIEEFNVPKNPRLIESLYANHHFRKPAHLRSEFEYRKRPPRGWRPRVATVINVGKFCQHAADVIVPMFPDPIEQEADRGN